MKLTAVKLEDKEMAREGGRSETLYMRPALQSAVFPNLVHGGNIYCWYASEYTTLRTTYISHSGWLVVNVQTRLCVRGILLLRISQGRQRLVEGWEPS